MLGTLQPQAFGISKVLYRDLIDSAAYVSALEALWCSKASAALMLSFSSESCKILTIKE